MSCYNLQDFRRTLMYDFRILSIRVKKIIQ